MDSHQFTAIRGIRLSDIVFPHFEFECTQTEDERLVPPSFAFEVNVKQLEERAYLAEIRMESDPEKPADFRALLIAQLEFSLPEQDQYPLSDAVGRFLQVNSLVLAWPYIRELVSSATVRMGFPALLMPMLNVTEMYERSLLGRKGEDEEEVPEAQGGTS